MKIIHNHELNKEIFLDEKYPLADIQALIFKMNTYKLNDGYIALDSSGRLNIWITEPSFHSSYYTKNEILQAIQNYKVPKKIKKIK